MGTVIIGWILILVGVLFLFLGFAAAAKNVLLDGWNKGSTESTQLDISLIRVLIDLVKELGKAPQWLALTIIGLVLIIFGSNWAF